MTVLPTTNPYFVRLYFNAIKPIKLKDMKYLLVIALPLLFSLSAFSEEKSKNLETIPIQNSCEKESCIKKSSKELCGKCCKEKYRFTNTGSDDNNIKFQNQAMTVSPDLAWDECIKCCKDAFPDKQEAKPRKRGK